MKKKPIFSVKHAHGELGTKPTWTGGEVPSGSWASAGSDAAKWVQSVAVCKGSDLVASGAGDGVVRLWQVDKGRFGGAGGLSQIGQVPCKGFANGLAIARSGRFVLAAVGQEPRMGRWGKFPGAANGLLMHPLEMDE